MAVGFIRIILLVTLLEDTLHSMDPEVFGPNENGQRL